MTIFVVIISIMTMVCIRVQYTSSTTEPYVLHSCMIIRNRTTETALSKHGNDILSASLKLLLLQRYSLELQLAFIILIAIYPAAFFDLLRGWRFKSCYSIQSRHRNYYSYSLISSHALLSCKDTYLILHTWPAAMDGNSNKSSLPWGISNEKLQPPSLGQISDSKLATFAVGQQKKSRFQKAREGTGCS